MSYAATDQGSHAVTQPSWDNFCLMLQNEKLLNADICPTHFCVLHFIQHPIYIIYRNEQVHVQRPILLPCHSSVNEKVELFQDQDVIQEKAAFTHSFEEA